MERPQFADCVLRSGVLPNIGLQDDTPEAGYCYLLSGEPEWPRMAVSRRHIADKVTFSLDRL